MGKIVMPKNSAKLEEIEAVLQIYYEAKTWISNDEYKTKLKKIIGDDQYSSSYTKKAQITSYFGFTIWEDINNAQSRRKITETGRMMYEAIKSNDINMERAILINALETVTFGRNNCGCPDSNSDIEPPALFIRAILDLNYLTYREFAFLLWKLEDFGANYTDVINELKVLRNSNHDFTLDDEANKYADCKPIMILVRWGFLAEDNSNSTGAKHIVIAPDVLNKYKKRLRNLKIYNIDMNCIDPIDDALNNKYKKAAEYLRQYVIETGLKIPDVRQTVENLYKEFRKKFAPSILADIPDDRLLQTIFYTSEKTDDSLFYWLEFQSDSRQYCGNITEDSSYKFSLFQKKDDGTWITGSSSNPEILSESQALIVGKEIRDALIKGCQLISTKELISLIDYEQLDDELKNVVGEKYWNLAWIHKYFSMMYPEKLSGFHSSKLQRHVLYALQIKPSEKYYARSGQITMVTKYANWIYAEFFIVFNDKFGEIKHFLRLGTSDKEKNYVDEWIKRSIVAIGWRKIGSLKDYLIANDINRNVLTERLEQLYYQNHANQASRKAGEIITFFKTNANSVFVAADGYRLIGMIDNLGDYFFNSESPMSNQKSGKWHFCFTDGEQFPNRNTGFRSTCYEISAENDVENMMFLYKKYYYELNDIEAEKDKYMNKIEFSPLIYKTGIDIKKERNRIIFGAPGTGKSFMLKKECKKYFEEMSGEYERVTFHPDYTYSQFVGTYKPVTDFEGKIRYEFVPGPFMRVYVEALKNGKSDTPKPFLLIIEEINRAKVAAVFGDVFQLLDRNSDGISEYSIQATEDISRYLALKLGGGPENYKEIKIPDNMFIWATMNSADQGVFPMDTAFKRRWSFEYINIDDAEEKLPKDEIKIGDNTSEKYSWNHLRKAINNNLIDNGINEDKLLGPFFMSEKTLKNAQNDSKSFNESFKNKVIMYLFEDVVKMRPSKLFNEKIDGMKLIYSDICKKFDDHGINIFNDKIVNEVKRLKKEKNIANQSGGQSTSTTVDDNQAGTSI